MSETDPGYTERKLTRTDGTVLHLEQRAAVAPARATLVMVHGFAAHCGRYREVAAAFARRGFAITTFDCRGHGQSTGRRGFVRRFADFLDDLHAVLELARETSASQGEPGLPLVLLGHSHGGTIALRYALENRSPPLFALVLVTPWLELKLKVPVWKLVLSKVVGRLWPSLALGNELRSEDTTRDPAVRARWADDPLVHHVATPRWFNEVRATQAYILDRAATLRVPTLIAVAGDDRIVSTEAALTFAKQAGAAAAVDVKVYEDAFHELFFEPDWKIIVEDFASWVVARLSAPYTSVIG